jgi:hypothetical protein
MTARNRMFVRAAIVEGNWDDASGSEGLVE